jgi:ubiquinone/menaquinone biosynthesis C-methylase UbiE
MRLMAGFLRIFFHLLYHPFAWAYDFVAWTVSLGRWKDWVESAVPFIEGTCILELGHGPGYLQRILHDQGFFPIGLDESPQMGVLAKKRLNKSGYTQIGLIRALGQGLPFSPGSFETIIATFPTEYIFMRMTIFEIKRILTEGGRLVLLPVAWVTGKGLLDRFAAWLFRVTGQAPSNFSAKVTSRLTKPLVSAGFQVETRLHEVKNSRVLIVIAKKTTASINLPLPST